MNISEPVVGFLTSASHDLIARHSIGVTGIQVATKEGLPQTVTNSTTLVDDNDLQLAVVTGWSYAGLLLLEVQGPVAGGFKLNLSAPANVYGEGGCFPDDIGPLAAGGTPAFTTNLTKTYATLSQSPSMLIIPFLICKLSASGTCKLQWAQGTADGAGTSLISGSTLILLRTGS
jgi:hypothetical protein